MHVVVCAVQELFRRTAADVHAECVVAALRDAGHTVELVRLPAAWDASRIFDAPMSWRMLPIDADLVIATTFPAYYVRHPRKVVWLARQHRGPYELSEAEWADLDYDDATLETQRLITEWDAQALAEAERVFAASAVIADRLARFPGVAAETLHAPPPLAPLLRTGEFGSYVLCPTALEPAQRPQLAIDGLAYARNVSVRIVGRGSMAAQLRARALNVGASDRVQLPGELTDVALAAMFAGALAVLYTPVEEEFGCVAQHAYLAGKPVITAADSGAVLDWVDDGVTGIVTDGSPEAVGAAYERLASDPALARKLGDNGRARVAELSWSSAVDTLLAR